MLFFLLIYFFFKCLSNYIYIFLSPRYIILLELRFFYLSVSDSFALFSLSFSLTLLPPLSFLFSLSLSFCISLSLSHCLFHPPPLSLFMSFSVPPSLSLSLHSFFLYICLSPILFYLSLSLSFFIYFLASKMLVLIWGHK